MRDECRCLCGHRCVPQRGPASKQAVSDARSCVHSAIPSARDPSGAAVQTHAPRHSSQVEGARGADNRGKARRSLPSSPHPFIFCAAHQRCEATTRRHAPSPAQRPAKPVLRRQMRVLRLLLPRRGRFMDAPVPLQGSKLSRSSRHSWALDTAGQCPDSAASR